MQYKLYFSAHSKVTSESSHNVFEKCFLQSTHHSLREFSNMFKERVRRLYIWRLSLSVSVINRKTDAGLHSLCVRFDQFHPLYRMLFLLCLTFFVQANISEIQQHVHCDLQNIQDIERPCQEEQPALVRIIGVIDDFSCDTEYIADPDKYLKEQALSFCGSCHP